MRIVGTRIVHALVVLITVTVVVFVVMRLVGDPVRSLLPLDAPQERYDALNAELGFDRPIWTQFVDYLGGIVRGDFGDSLWQSRSVMGIIAETLPITLTLTITGMVVGLVIGLPMGAAAAVRPGGLVDRITSFFSLISFSIPQFWLGLLLVMIFAVVLQWLPANGAAGVSSLILPALTLGLPVAGGLAVLVRSALIDELNRPWIVVSRSRGLPFHRVLFSHAMRNAFPPVLTMIGWDTARMLAGQTVIIEVLFAWPGIGFAAYQAVERNDFYLLQAIVLVIALITVTINLVVDLVHVKLDPRVEVS